MSNSSVPSLLSVYAQLTSFAKLENFWSLFDTAFGSSYDFATAATLRSQWQSGNFSQFPQIEVVSSEVLGSAKGAYAISTNRIYLSDRFVSRASQQSLEAVILEEFGHFVDAQVNNTDTLGDEGELFSAVVRGVSLSAAELSRIKAEDDHGIVSLGGQLIAIEKATPTILTVTTTVDQNNGVTTDGLSLREAILIANANPNTDYEIHLTGGLTYNLTADEADESAGLTGDLDISSRNNVLYIVSIGTQKATINALSNSDRVFAVGSDGRLSLQNVVVTGGFVSSYQAGGGIYVASTGLLDLYNTTVTNNRSGSGGGIYNLGTTYLRNGSVISDNRTADPTISIGIVKRIPNEGGGIINYGTLFVINSTINNNNAADLGKGGGISNRGNLFVINSTISNNTSSVVGDGGGIYNLDGSATLVNTTVSGNVSRREGGGIYNVSVLNLQNSTITNNIAYSRQSNSFAGGGIDNGSGTVNLRNTIVAGNFRSLDSQGYNRIAADLRGTFNGNNNNLIGTLDGSVGTIGTGTDIVNANVQLSPLQNNGGLTLTHIPLSGSLAINTGNNSLIPVDSEDIDGDGDTTEQLPFDGRNLVRISGVTVDIGAVEAQNPAILPAITLAIAPVSVLEDGIPNLVYTFTRTGATTNALTVNYGIAGTADTTDYTGATPGTGKTITFGAGSATATLTIEPTADTTIESDETIALTLATGSGYTVGTTTTVTGKIVNDDTITNDNFSGRSILIGNSVIITSSNVGATGETGEPNHADISTPLNSLWWSWTAGGNGNVTISTNGSDFDTTLAVYTGTSVGSLTAIASNDDVNGNEGIERSSAVAFSATSGITYQIAVDGYNEATGNINLTLSFTPNFPSITLAVAPASALEDGTSNLIYTFTRTGVTTSPLTINYSIAGTADATDYTGATPGIGKTITFAAGSATATLTIDPTADPTIEANETVALTLATGTGYTIGTATAVTGTITNDDLPNITLAVSPASVLENGTTNLVYTFTRTGPTTNALTVNYGITGTADATDYTGATPGTGKTITFASGSATATLTIDPTADTTIEANETVALTLATGTGYTIGTATAVTGTITNDDLPSITLAVAPASVLENGTTNLIYTFTRTGATTNALTVNYGITGTSDATDYTGATPGTGKTITFAAGSATVTLTIDPTADTTVEANETVALTLATGTGYTIGTTSAVTGTITNDDVVTLPSITLAVAPVSVLEDGTPNLIYTFTRTGATTNALTVNYGITGTATNGTDYATIGTSVTFVAGSSTATVTVNPTADTVIEANETVALTLVTGTGYTIGTTTAVTGTIINDDPTITLGLNFSGISENSPSNFVYTFNRTGPTTNALTVNYSIAGTATATDYIGATPGVGKTIIFAAGSATATLTLDPTADTTLETDETISLQLATGNGYTIGTTAAQVATIINDDGTRRQKGTNGQDVILGTNLRDILSGGLGNDILTGGLGGDSFSFNALNEGIDTITDFSVGNDDLFVKGSGFGGGLISGDIITAAQFVIGTAATNTSQRFIYNATNGALFFDVDGSGATAASQFASLSPNLALTYEDIFVI